LIRPLPVAAAKGYPGGLRNPLVVVAVEVITNGLAVLATPSVKVAESPGWKELCEGVKVDPGVTITAYAVPDVYTAPFGHPVAKHIDCMEAPEEGILIPETAEYEASKPKELSKAAKAETSAFRSRTPA